MPYEKSIDDLFHEITNGHDIHPWQRALAKESKVRNCTIRVPTGLGKTLGVLTSWLYHRVLLMNTNWPTRLVWCLPMRTLVEQTYSEATKLITRLTLKNQVGVHVLMGGVDEDRWYDEPETPAILIGTQDMLLSRAMNRGYSMYPSLWPRAFGLINSDVLWVMDEVQLMGVGLATSAQLQAFAENDVARKKSTGKPRITWWMSATLQSTWLRTKETQSLMQDLQNNALTVEPTDRNGELWETAKRIERRAVEPDEWPELILKQHQIHKADPVTGRQTLVIVNTVKQACRLFDVVRKHLKSDEAPELILIHSRFRPAERENWFAKFLSRDNLSQNTNRILIATQVVEAGVDISASCLISELSPWPSLVQRFGRAARYGGTAEIVVLDQKHTDKKNALPYELKELNAARDAIDRIDDVSIGNLEDFEASLSGDELSVLYPYDPLHVLLEHEFDELFDTSPDLAGADVDISRFIRDGDDTRNLQVFWRSWDDDRPPADLQPTRRELCSVPIIDAKKWVKNAEKGLLFFWNYLLGEWVPAIESELRPGMVILADPDTGGYNEQLGFTGAKKKNESVSVVINADSQKIGFQSDAFEASEDSSKVAVWKTIATHCRDAMTVGNEISRAVALDARFHAVVSLTLRLHDWGKAHPSFASGTYRVHPLRIDLAKAPGNAWRAMDRLYDTPTHGPRRGFRHELASCLAALELLRGVNPSHAAILGREQKMLIACGLNPMLETASWVHNPIAIELNQLTESEVNLLLFLIASHHGKVRASLQASAKDQWFPIDKPFVGDGYPIRGVRDGDEIPPVALPLESNDQEMPNISLNLSAAVMGLSERYGKSWSERIATLLSSYGPFTLGYLEAIVRAADCRASDVSRAPGRDPDPLLAGINLVEGGESDNLIMDNKQAKRKVVDV